jgi:hypothetical protein
MTACANAHKPTLNTLFAIKQEVIYIKHRSSPLHFTKGKPYFSSSTYIQELGASTQGKSLLYICSFSKLNVYTFMHNG